MDGFCFWPGWASISRRNGGITSRRGTFCKEGIHAYHCWGRLDEDWTKDIKLASPDEHEHPKTEQQEQPSARRSPRWERPRPEHQEPEFDPNEFDGMYFEEPPDLERASTAAGRSVKTSTKWQPNLTAIIRPVELSVSGLLPSRRRPHKNPSVLNPLWQEIYHTDQEMQFVPRAPSHRTISSPPEGGRCDQCYAAYCQALRHAALTAVHATMILTF